MVAVRGYLTFPTLNQSVEWDAYLIICCLFLLVFSTTVNQVHRFVQGWEDKWRFDLHTMLGPRFPSWKTWKIDLFLSGDKLVGGFGSSNLACTAEGFSPTFTYTPGSQTQNVVVDIEIGNSIVSSRGITVDFPMAYVYASEHGKTLFLPEVKQSKIGRDTAVWRKISVYS